MILIHILLNNSKRIMMINIYNLIISFNIKELSFELLLCNKNKIKYEKLLILKDWFDY